MYLKKHRVRKAGTDEYDQFWVRLTQIFGFFLEFLKGEQSNTESRKEALRKKLCPNLS